MILLAGVATVAGVVLLGRPRPRRTRDVPAQRPAAESDRLRRYRVLWAALAAIAAATFVGGPAGPVAGLVAAVACWAVIARAEPASVRRRREAVARDLPHVVALLAAALRAGAAPATAIEVVADALPGPAAERLRPVSARLRLGGSPERVWADLAQTPELSVLGRTLGRAHRTGAPVVAAIERLADDLADRSRAEVEDRARAVGVKAAVPLGLCLLPAFVLLGIVPVVAGLLGSLAW